MGDHLLLADGQHATGWDALLGIAFLALCGFVMAAVVWAVKRRG
jgi:hypothetical protein